MDSAIFFAADKLFSVINPDLPALKEGTEARTPLGLEDKLHCQSLMRHTLLSGSAVQ